MNDKLTNASMDEIRKMCVVGWMKVVQNRCEHVREVFIQQWLMNGSVNDDYDSEVLVVNPNINILPKMDN